jgi:hypothetical protein
MDTGKLDEAIAALSKREGIHEKDGNRLIGVWSREDSAPPLLVELPQWAESRGIDSVIWTALSQSLVARLHVFLMLSRSSAISEGSLGESAERYIRLAPKQIDTFYRRRIEAEFQRTPPEPGF